jgi:Aminotransferase class-V
VSVSPRIAQLTDEAFRRHEFPVCQRRIYFAHAAVAPLPREVAEAMIDYIHTASEGGQKFEATLQQMSETRALAAQLIGCGAEEIALLGPTSLGLNLIAQGLDWKSGEMIEMLQRALEPRYGLHVSSAGCRCPDYFINSTDRLRLISRVIFRCICAGIPVTRRGRILPLSVTNFFKRSGFL